MSSDLNGLRPFGFRSVGALVLAGVIAAVSSPRSAGPKFRPDDPIRVDDDRAIDASGAGPLEGSNAYDFVENTFFDRGDRHQVHAVNVNTIDEVPDSSWFTNRIGVRDLPLDELVRGPNHLDTIDIEGWPIAEGKSRGVTPGYRILDPAGQLYQVKFDPPSNPEMGSGAEMIGAAVYHALGYNVVEGYIVEIDPAKIVISPTATFVGMDGRKRRITRADVDRLLRRAARGPNGKYRATLSRFAEGKPLGFFRYYGTRPDDPNDIHPHEHRRELRANRVFSAWLNHDDSRALNSLDMLETQNGRSYVKHYMFDFGSIMGSGSTRAQAPRAGNEYILEWKPGFLTLATLGLWVRPWALVRYPDVAGSVGRFEADFFDPVSWKPEYPNPAFNNIRADDAFWAARLVARFSDQAIRAVVAKARYSDPEAGEYVTNTLITRRDKVLKAWLTGVNPIVDVSLSPEGVLSFHNAVLDARVAEGAVSYEVTWLEFDNATGATRPSGEPARTTETRLTVPQGFTETRQYVAAAIRSFHSAYPAWQQPVTVYFQRDGAGWRTVGLERLPD